MIWSRVLVVSKKLPALLAMLALSSVVTGYALGKQDKGDEINAEGVVVAVQLAPGAVRSAMEVNAEPGETSLRYGWCW